MGRLMMHRKLVYVHGLGLSYSFGIWCSEKGTTVALMRLGLVLLVFLLSAFDNLSIPSISAEHASASVFVEFALASPRLLMGFAFLFL
jgi:hypothetical protein